MRYGEQNQLKSNVNSRQACSNIVNIHKLMHVTITMLLDERIKTLIGFNIPYRRRRT